MEKRHRYDFTKKSKGGTTMILSSSPREEEEEEEEERRRQRRAKVEQRMMVEKKQRREDVRGESIYPPDEELGCRRCHRLTHFARDCPELKAARDKLEARKRQTAASKSAENQTRSLPITFLREKEKKEISRKKEQQLVNTTATSTTETNERKVVGSEWWRDILNQHEPLREYVLKRAREENKESIFASTTAANEDTDMNEAFAFAKEELRLLRKRFLEGSDDEKITDSMVVALQFDIDAGGLLDQFERERLKSVRTKMENGRRNDFGARTSNNGGNRMCDDAGRLARLEYVSFSSDEKDDEFDENDLFAFASRRITNAFFAHGGGMGVLEDLKNSGNGACLELPYPPFGTFPIGDENDDYDVDDTDRNSNNAEEEEEEKEEQNHIQGAFAALGLESIISLVSPQLSPKRGGKEEATIETAASRHTKKQRSRCVYVTNSGLEDITLVALRIVDAKKINETEGVMTVNKIGKDKEGKNEDPRCTTGQSSSSSSVFSLRDDYNISQHRATKRETSNSSNRRRPTVRIPAGGVYPVTVECSIDSETKRSYVTSWIIAVFGTKKHELRACATQCSVLITGSNVFNNPVKSLSLLSEEATPFIPEALRCAFDAQPQEYYPPPGNYLDTIWGYIGRYFLSIENRNILPAPADYYASKLPTWLFTYQFRRAMVLDPNFKVFIESHNHAPWTKSLEWASVFRSISSHPLSASPSPSHSGKETFYKTLLKSARLLYIEEAQQNKDVKRYDMFNRTLKRIGQSEQSELLVYSLEVPGLQNGYPPIVVGDVVRCRVACVARHKELSPFLEYGFRIVAIVSKTQTLHLQAPWTVTSDGTSDKLSTREARNQEIMKVHVRFAMDENFFSRCRAALRACSTLKVEYPSQASKNEQQRLQRRDDLRTLDEIERLRRGINDEQYEFVMRCRRKREVLSLEQSKRENETNASVNIKGLTVAPLVCFGPPGTGKTLTIAHAVLDALSINPDARILVCAPAPYAADVILDRIILEHPKYFHNTTASTNVYCRIDDPRRAMSEKMGSITPFCVDVKDWFASKRKRYKEMEHSARVLVCSCVSAGILYEAMKATYQARAKVNFDVDGAQYQYVNFAFRSFFDVTDLDKDRGQKAGLTHLFIDEAAQATIPEVLIPMSLVNERTLVVMSGDSKQLGPLVHSKVAIRGGLEKSLLETCVDMISERKTTKSSANGTDTTDDNLVTLTKNYRSHSDILEIASEYFYGGKLEAFVSEKDIRIPEDEVFQRLKLATMQHNSNNEEDGAADHHISRRYRNVFVAVEGLEEVEMTKSQSQVETKSFSNALECEKVCEIISALLSSSDAKNNRIIPSDVEVIAVYRRQVLALRQVLRQINLGAIRVGTIDDYQGQEAKVIIISTVVSTGPSASRRRRNGEEGYGEEEAKHTILSDPKRFNVATSRAKALNIIVGHPKALRLFPNWSRLIRKISQNGASSVSDASVTTTSRSTMTSSNKPLLPPSDGKNSDNDDVQFFIDEYAAIEEELEKEKTKMMSIFDDDDLPWRVQL